jgi:hypothetical protein
MLKNQFSPWIALIPLTILIYFLKKKSASGEILKFLAIVILTFWFIISFAKTKLDWYNAPLFPYLAIVVGYLIFEIYKLLYESVNIGKVGIYIFMLFYLIGVFYYPNKMLRDSNSGREIGVDYGTLMKRAKELHPQYKSYKVLVPYFSPSAIYYCQYLNLLYNYQTRTSCFDQYIDVNLGDTILFSHPAIHQKLINDYYYTVIDNYFDYALVKVDSLKRK